MAQPTVLALFMIFPLKFAFLCMCILNTTVIRSQLSGATTETGAILESNLRVGVMPVIPLNVPMRHTFLTIFLSLYSHESRSLFKNLNLLFLQNFA